MQNGSLSIDQSNLAFEVVGSSPKVIFVGEAATSNEIKNGVPFSTEAGAFFRQELRTITPEYVLVNFVTSADTTQKEMAKNELMSFIRQSKPDLVVLLGRATYEVVLPGDYWQGRSVTDVTRKKPTEIDGISYAASFHPSFISRNGGKDAPQYQDFVRRLTNLISRSAGEGGVDLKINITDLDSLREVLASYENETDLGTDYEGTSLDPFTKKFKALGFSLSTLERATYVHFHRPITTEEEELMADFFSRKSPWVYNVNYELQVSWSKTAKKLIRFNDAFTLCKIDCSSASLKENARKYVGAEYWEEMVGQIVNLFYHNFQVMKKFEKLDPSNEKEAEGFVFFELLKGGRYEDAQQHSWAKHYPVIFDTVNELSRFCTPEQISRGFQQYPYEWAACPVEIMGEYCCYDSFYTLKIKHHLWDKYKYFYPYYITQSWLGATMESYGLNWDDETASKHEEYYIDEATRSLFQLIHIMDFPDVTVKKKLSGRGKTAVYEDEFRNTDWYRLRAREIMMDQAKPPAQKLDELKWIFNPMSNLATGQAPFWNKYRSDFVTAVTMFLVLEEALIASPIIPDESVKLFDVTDLNATIEKLITADWKSFETVQPRDIPDIQKAIYAIIGDLTKKIEWKFGKFKSEVLEWQYEAHKKYGSLDIDKKETWSTEFALLYFLRRFKKVMKSRSTYINGKVGRGKVWLAEVNDYTKPPIRIKPYFTVQSESGGKYQLKDNERWILDTEFSVCTAETKRWKSPIHTIPWGSELREIYYARWWDGLFMHYDYSQMEVRALAAMSKDQALLAAFADPDTDIHRFIASRIWKKKPEDVTSGERRFSKLATFSLLYGKTVEGFATEFMKGDLAAARKLFNDFYAAFPQVAEWIQARHAEVKQNGKVSTIFGDPLYIDVNADPMGALRLAQNWPIQSSASSIAGWAIWMNYEDSLRNSLPVLPMVFTHDAHDMEFRSQNLFEVIDTVLRNAVDLPKARFGIPAKIDWEIGVNQSDAIEFKELSRQNETRLYEFSCNKRALEPVLSRLSHYFDIEHEIEKEETEYESLSEIFMNKRAFSKYLGTDVTSLGGKLKLTKKSGLRVPA